MSSIFYLLNEKLCSYFIFQLRTFRLLSIKVLKWFAITDLTSKIDLSQWHKASSWSCQQLIYSSLNKHEKKSAAYFFFVRTLSATGIYFTLHIYVVLMLLSEWFRGRRFASMFTHTSQILFSLKIIVVVVVVVIL